MFYINIPIILSGLNNAPIGLDGGWLDAIFEAIDGAKDGGKDGGCIAVSFFPIIAAIPDALLGEILVTLLDVILDEIDGAKDGGFVGAINTMSVLLLVF